MERQWVNRKVYDVKLSAKDSSRSTEIMTGRVVDIISGLESAVLQAEKLGYKNLEVRWGYHADGASCYDLVGDRLEDDGEFVRRVEREKEKEEKDRALYEELKVKFENQ